MTRQSRLTDGADVPDGLILPVVLVAPAFDTPEGPVDDIPGDAAGGFVFRAGALPAERADRPAGGVADVFKVCPPGWAKCMGCLPAARVL